MERTRIFATSFVLLLASPLAHAAELIQNGGFEDNGGVGTSTFAGWTTYTQAGSAGLFAVQTGTSSPINNSSVEAPPEGSFAAMTDQSGPGSYALYQNVTIPADAAAVSFSAQIYIRTAAQDFVAPTTLDYTAGPNQQFRVDIVDPASGPQDLGAAVLENLFITTPGDPLVQPYQTITADLSAYAGQTIRLRFAEADTNGVFNAGVDAVSMSTPTEVQSIPTTSFWAGVLLSLMIGLAGLAGMRRRVTGDG